MQYSSVLPRSRSVLPVSESLILAGRCRRRRYTSIRKGLELAGLPAWHQRMHASTQTLARISCEEGEREGGGRIASVSVPHPSPSVSQLSPLNSNLRPGFGSLQHGSDLRGPRNSQAPFSSSIFGLDRGERTLGCVMGEGRRSPRSRVYVHKRCVSALAPFFSPIRAQKTKLFGSWSSSVST